MGMYNYIGHSGDQVKCFYVPCIPVSKDELGVYRASFGTSGGRLVNVNDTPYMTPYYNYGEDFLILDYPLSWDRDNTQVHIVKNGKWVATKLVSELDDDFEMPPVVIDGHACRYKIDTLDELLTFLVEHEEASNGYESMYANALEQANLARFPSIEEWRALDHDAMLAQHEYRMNAMDAAYNTYQKPFNEKWLDDKDSVLEILGLAIADYIENTCNADWKRHDFEWHIIFTDAIDRIHQEFDNPIEAYLKWCRDNGIDEEIVNEEMVYDIVNRYNTTPSEELFADYEEMKAGRGW